MCNDEDLKKRTNETAGKLFGKGIKAAPPYLTWKAFDRDLANDLSMHITGNLYSREVLPRPERQMAHSGWERLRTIKHLKCMISDM